MRRPALVVTFVLAGAWACGSSTTDSGKAPDTSPDKPIDAAYCEDYCGAQASAGTLQSSRDDCMSSCCKNVSGGCPARQPQQGPDDSGTSPTTDGGNTDGSACAQPCGTKCCNTGEGCHDDGSGPTCVPTCTSGSDCPTGCCAPSTNAAGDPVGPYVCKQNDGKAYDCCAGFTVNCQVANTCCVKDGNGNEFCAGKCSANTECGAAHCIGYEFSFLRTTCKGPTACGP